MVPREVNFEPKASSSPKKEVNQVPSMSDENVGENTPPDSGSRGALDDEESAGKMLDLAAEDADVETWHTIKMKARHTQDELRSHIIFNEEKTNGDLRRRSKQAILHLTFTEMRITDLEKELRNLRAEIRNLPDDFKLREKKKQCPVYHSILKRSGPDEFRTTKNSMFVPIDQRPALEALYTDSIHHMEAGIRRSPRN